MADADDKLAGWWVKWREADFTWAGLAKHKLQGWVVADGLLREADNGRVYGQPILETPQPVRGRPATLQDYWRCDPETGRLRSDEALIAAGELVFRAVAPHRGPGAAAPSPPSIGAGGENGGGGAAAPNLPPETYHIAHLPLAYADGAPTGKADWPKDALDALVAPRLLAASETVWEGELYSRKIIGPDRDAQLQGGIWLKAAAHPKGADPPLSIRHTLALIFGDASFANAKFSGDARFNDAAFSGDAGFNGAAFSGDAWFHSAAFSGVAGFVGAAFSGDAGFERAAFSRDAWFEGAAFGGAARFDGAAFSGEASFYGATFSGDARFDGAAFSGFADFRGAAFSGFADFRGATFSGDAGFWDAAFSGEARFEGAAFSGFADFRGATFSGDAGFWDAAFSGDAGFTGAAFSGEAGFRYAAFSGEARFRDAAFSGEARFNGAAFAKAAYFVDARFAKTISFAAHKEWNKPPKATSFTGPARFIRAVFEGVPTFDDAVFQNDVDFTAAVFEKLASFERIKWPAAAAHWHRAFDQALFRGTLSLYGAGLQRFAAFDGATFERGVQIDEAAEADAKKTFRAELAAAKAAADDKTDRDARLRELERGCRVLKLAFERAADKAREQTLYRFELQARRAQKKLPPGEKLFSSLYALASDYGASMIRPFIALGVLLCAFALLYWGCGLLTGQAAFRPSLAAFDLGVAAQALEFSLINTFRPLSALSADGFREGTLGARLLDSDDLTALGVRALSIVQSLLAIVLAFLFALAVRRRFQIS